MFLVEVEAFEFDEGFTGAFDVDGTGFAGFAPKQTLFKLKTRTSNKF